MADSGNDAGADVSDGFVVAPIESEAGVRIGYGNSAVDAISHAWLKWLAIVVGAWILLASAIGAQYLLRDVTDLVRRSYNAGTNLPILPTAIEVWSLVSTASRCAAAVGLVVLARRRVAVRNLAATLTLLLAIDIALTLVLHAASPVAVSATRPPSSLETLSYVLFALSGAALPAFVWLGSVRTDGLPWRWTFRLGWWMSLLLVIQLVVRAIQFASTGAGVSGPRTDSQVSLFHVQPQLAVQLLAAVFVLATLQLRQPSPRRAAGQGVLGLLVVAACDAFPGLDSAISLAFREHSFHTLISLVAYCSRTLVPAIVIAIHWKLLPDADSHSGDAVAAK